MSSGKSLGIFWGNNSFSVVETHQDAPQVVFRVLHQPVPVIDPVSPVVNTDEIQYVAPLKEAIKSHGIGLTDVNLSLPSKDIVIRSFVIPHVKQSEVRGVVEFEVKRYIPFNLKDLAYNFHAVSFVEDKARRMRVHFVGIRREILERYKTILRHAGLNVVYSEPAPMCLTRVLLSRKLVRADQKVAILLTDITDPGIIIIDKGIVQFVRDFQLQNPTLNMAPLDLDLLRKKLFNEIKISLDFYMRQFKSEKIEELYSLSFASDDDLTGRLQKELELSVKKINAQAIGKFSMTPDAGLVSAHGVNLRSSAKAVEFNLSGVLPTPSQAVKIQEQIPEEFIPAIKVGVVCLAVLAVVFFLTKMNVANVKKKYDALVEVQGPFVEMKPEDIEARIKENRDKLKEYTDAYQKSDLSFLVTHLAKSIPGGIWLSELDIKYDRTKKATPVGQPSAAGEGAVDGHSHRPVVVEMSGYSYTDEANEQFKMVYGFVNVLKSDKILEKYSKNVNLSGIQSEESGDVVLTSFKVEVK